MLLRFRAGNHRSLHAPQELSLVASPLDDDPAGLIPCKAAPHGTLVPAAVIYGANASGKSNVIDALRWMRNAILYSHSRGEPGKEIEREPFALSVAASTEPSTYDIDFLVKDIHYHYGFEVSNKAFTNEWLYSYPDNRQQTLFERTGDTFKFGRNFKGKNKTISKLSRGNSLFLSAAAQNNHESILDITEFFRTYQRVVDRYVDGDLVSRKIAKEGLDQRALDLLRDIGTGITESRTVELEIPDDVVQVQKDIFSAVNRILVSQGLLDPNVDPVPEKKIVRLELAHKSLSQSDIFFDLNLESAGTQRLVALLPAALRALDTGSLLVVDELNASLHTQACEAVLALFSRPETNPKGAQLITTTHDTNLLRSPLLRRDQIWFTEKDDGGATHLYPLTDFRTRKGDNLEKGYLQGRYGAIPFAGALPSCLARGAE
ncbi:ATPase AAA-type core domain-containing protein [Azospirillaceae bacterium]